MVNSKLNVTLTALAFPRRDLSPALVGLVEYARREPLLAENINFVIHQFQYVDDVSVLADNLCREPGNLYAFSCYVWNFHECLQLAKLVKERLPQSVVLFGGPEATGLAGHLLEQYRFIDYVIKGEGEEPFKRFLMCMLDKSGLSNVPSLVYRNDSGEVLETVPAEQSDIGLLPSVCGSDYYVNYLNQATETVTVTFETSRGCPFRCRYCSWGGKQVRFHPLDRVFAGLRKVLNHPSVRRIYITDADIFLNKRRGKEILNFLLNNNPFKVPVIFEVNPEILDDETIELISKFGDDEFAFGLQSSSPAVLESINRRFNSQRYCENITKLKAVNPEVKIWFSLIVGLPGDSLATFKQSLAFAVRMMPHSLYIHEFLCLPGSEFFKEQAKYGFLCQTEAPHKLIYHRTFGQRDYFAAKELGFYVSLFHYYGFVKEPLFTLWEKTNTPEINLLHWYERFVEFLRQRIDLTGGKDVKEVPSFLFDEYYQKATGDKELTGRLKLLFDRFYVMLENELENDVLAFEGAAV